METDDGYDADLWKRMAVELGLQGLAVPEAYGGAGFGAGWSLGFGGVDRSLLATIARTRKHARVSFDAAHATALSTTDGETMLGRALDVAATLFAAEQVGVAERALAMATASAKLRVQF